MEMTWFQKHLQYNISTLVRELEIELEKYWQREIESCAIQAGANSHRKECTKEIKTVEVTREEFPLLCKHLHQWMPRDGNGSEISHRIINTFYLL